MYFQSIRPSLCFLNYCATICEAVLKVGKRGLCSSYSLHSGRKGSLPVCSNPPSSSPQMQTFSGLSSLGSTLQSSGGPSAVLTQLLQTLISHCLFPVSLWIFCHHLCPLSPPKLCLNSFCLQTSSSSSLIFFYYCCFCFSNNQGRSLESISNSHLAMSLMFTY